MRNWISSFLLLVGLTTIGFGVAQGGALSPSFYYRIDQENNIPAANTDIRLWKSSVPITGDATRFAFTSNQAGNNDIYVMQANGSHLERLTTHSADDTSPTWSPDGKKIAFASFRDGNWEIYTMNVDGTAQTRLTSNAQFDGSPAWSPDGTKIAFASERDGNREIYLMNANGGSPQRLTNQARIDDQPAWSPEGSRIVFVSDRDEDREIYVMSANGSSSQRLTNSQFTDERPSWSPDGNRITFVSMRDDGLTGEIYLMEQNGTNPQRLTNNSYYETEPVWSPDGDRIAFSRFHFGQVESTKEIYTIAFFGGDAVQITSNNFMEGTPAWQPLALNDGLIVYKLMVENTTSTDAVNVKVIDPLPTSVKFLFADTGDWVCSTPAQSASGTVSCTLDTLSGSQSSSFQIFGEFRSDTSDIVITNTATASANNDSTPSNNSASATRQVVNATDLVLEMFAPTLIEAGGEITYTLAISNLSSTTAQNVLIVDSLPAEMTYLSCNVSGNGACVTQNGTITISYASLAPAEIQTIQLKAAIASGLPANSLLVNHALASSSTLDLNANDNQTSSTASFASSKRDVRITKQANLSTVATSGQLAYTIHVHNAGPSDLTPQIDHARLFTNTQPLAINSCANTNPNCFSAITVSGLTAPIYKVAVSLFEFSHDTPEAVDLVLVAPDGTKVTLLSDAGSNIDPGVIDIRFDDNGIPGSDVESLTNTTYKPTNFGASDLFGALGTVNDLQPTLSRFKNVTNPNGNWKLYAVDDQGVGGFINGGWALAIVDASSPIEKLVVTDSLPKGVTFVAASGTDWQVSHVNGKVTANLFQLTTGVTATLKITVAAPSQTGWITNTATVTVPGESNSANNHTSATTWVEAPISQLVASNSSPTSLSAATHFTATIGSGSSVQYTWNFGDGTPLATGASLDHTYVAIGSYTAVVTATNGISTQSASTTVVVESSTNNIYLPLISR